MGFFSNFWTFIHGSVLGSVSDVTTNIANSLEPAAVTFATLYVMLWGSLHLRGAIEEPFGDGVKRIIQMGAIFAVAIDLWHYNEVFVDFFVTTPDALANAILGGNEAISAIDAIWNDGSDAAESLLVQGTIMNSNISFYISGFVLYFFIGAICVWMTYLYCLSLVAVGLLLAIGPLFVIGLMFETTKRFFETWLAQLSTYALIIVIAAVAAKILLNVVVANVTAANAMGAGITIAFANQVCLASAIVLIIMKQVPSIAAALGSGVALSTFNALSRVMGGATRNTANSSYQFMRGIADGRAGHQSSRYLSLSRNIGTRIGGQRPAHPDRQSGGKIAREAVFK